MLPMATETHAKATLITPLCLQTCVVLSKVGRLTASVRLPLKRRKKRKKTPLVGKTPLHSGQFISLQYCNPIYDQHEQNRCPCMLLQLPCVKEETKTAVGRVGDGKVGHKAKRVIKKRGRGREWRAVSKGYRVRRRDAGSHGNVAEN